MPFTLAHPLAILPFARRPLVGSALAVGAMSPDLVYFLALHPHLGDLTHSIPGILLFDLPLSLALLVVFHAFVAAPLVALLPARARAVAAPLADAARRWPTPRRALAIVVSVLLGAATHVVWDAFTHYDGWVVRRVPLLRLDVWTGEPLYSVLQMGCSVLGMAGLALWARSRVAAHRHNRNVRQPTGPRYAPPRHPVRVRLAVVAAAAGVAGLNLVAGLARYFDVPALTVTRHLAAGSGESFELSIAMARVSIGLTTGTFLALMALGLFRAATDRA